MMYLIVLPQTAVHKKKSRIHRQCFSDFQTSIFNKKDEKYCVHFIKKKKLCVWLKCCFTSTETVGLLGTGAQDVHLDFHTAPELWILFYINFFFFFFF